MYRLLPVVLFFKVMKDKYLKLSSTHKEIKYYQLVLIKQQDFGMHKQVKVFKFYKAIKTKFSHVCLIMKEIPLLQDLRITHVKFGEIHKYTKRND
jgi:hypothetical protein